MWNLRLNNTSGAKWDIIFDQSGQVLVYDNLKDLIHQKVKSLLLTMKGEWFRNTSIGVPYFTHIFVKPIDLNQIRAVLRLAIMQDIHIEKFEIENINFRNFVVSSKDRSLVVEMDIITKNGTLAYKERLSI